MRQIFLRLSVILWFIPGSIFDNLFTGKILEDIVEKGRKEVRGVVFHTVADNAIRPVVDNLIGGFLRRR